TELAKCDWFRQRIIGFQKVATHDKRLQVKQWLGDWYPAEVEGCDCKSIADIGKGAKTTYIKVGAFTFEAVKFALLDYLNRVASTPLKQENSYLKSVAFEGDKLDGRVVDLSPELNTFIGIRGSGKSTILESIRYALDVPFAKNTADRDYKEGSVRNALGSGGKITLIAVDRHGQEYEIRRIIGEQPDVYVNGKLQPGINIRETVLHKPIYFGQKDLSSTGQGFENDLVEKLVGDHLVDIRQAIAVKRQTVVELTQRLQKLSDVGEKQREYQAKKQEAEFDQDDRAVKDISNFVGGYIQELDDLIARFADDFASRAKYASKQNQEFFVAVFAIFKRVLQGFAELKKIILEAKSDLNE